MEFPAFAWASGEEGSDPIVQYDGKRVRVDEFASSGHLQRLETDLADVAGIGIKVWRYGMPWRLTERRPGEYDWSLWDRALAACAAHGLTPVIDLCHFGLPDHYAGFCDPAWVDGLGRYAHAFLTRYSQPCWFTPVNEPYTVALTAGLMGVWNDCRSSLEDFAVALSYCVLANLQVMQRIRQDRDAWFVSADAIACPLVVGSPQNEMAELARALSWTVWDLQFSQPLHSMVQRAFDAVDPDVRRRIDALATTERTIVGHDFYPVSVLPFGKTREELTIAEHLDVYAAEARVWYARYGVDFWVAETSNLGLPVARQTEWLTGLVETLQRLRAGGLGVRGVCWYSRGDQYDWDTLLTQPIGRVTHVGLFDTERQPRPVVDAWRRLVAAA